MTRLVKLGFSVLAGLVTYSVLEVMYPEELEGVDEAPPTAPDLRAVQPAPKAPAQARTEPPPSTSSNGADHEVLEHGAQ